MSRRICRRTGPSGRDGRAFRQSRTDPRGLGQGRHAQGQRDGVAGGGGRAALRGGGSADPTGSNLTRAKGQRAIPDLVVPRPCDAGETAEAWEIALVAADLLAADGIRAAVISAPSFELYSVQGDGYRTAVLGAAPRVGVEAAIRQDRDAPLREGDAFIGMAGFGASAPAAAL